MKKKKEKFQVTPGDILFLIPVLILISMHFFYDLRIVQTGSMEPTLKVGALAIINPRLEPQVNDVAMYKKGEGYVIHRIIRIKGDNYYFQGDNVPDEDVFNPLHRSEIIGPVVVRINFVAPLIKNILKLE